MNNPFKRAPWELLPNKGMIGLGLAPVVCHVEQSDRRPLWLFWGYAVACGGLMLKIVLAFL